MNMDSSIEDRFRALEKQNGRFKKLFLLIFVSALSFPLLGQLTNGKFYKIEAYRVVANELHLSDGLKNRVSFYTVPNKGVSFLQCPVLMAAAHLAVM